MTPTSNAATIPLCKAFTHFNISSQGFSMWKKEHTLPTSQNPALSYLIQPLTWVLNLAFLLWH